MAKDEKTVGIWATGGGPTGGRALYGMLKYLEEVGIWPKRVKVIGGTSIGAYMFTLAAATAAPAAELIEQSFECPPEVAAAPNLKTKIGFFDIEPSLEFVKTHVFHGQNPKLNETPIPLVMSVTNWGTLESKFVHGDIPLLDALRQTIGNPLFFNLTESKDGVIGDSGITTSVGVDYLRKTYDIKKTILLDVESQHNWHPQSSMNEPLPTIARRMLEATLLLTKIPFLGTKVKESFLPSKLSALEHFPYTIAIIDRASTAFLTQGIDMQIKQQKPSVVVRLEEVIEIKNLGLDAFDRKVGMEQIAYGYEAAKRQAKDIGKILN